MPSKRKKYSARFPPARIKKIMQTDEEVGKVAAAVPVVISRALELFIESLIIKAGENTMSKNAKTLTTTHIKQTIQAEKKFDFLTDLVASIPDHQAEEESDISGDVKKQKVPRQRKQKGEPGKRRKRKNNSGSSDEETEENNDTNDDDEDGESTETDEEQSQDSNSTDVFHRSDSVDVPRASNSLSEEPLNLCSNRGSGEGFVHNQDLSKLQNLKGPLHTGVGYPVPIKNNVLPGSGGFYSKPQGSAIPEIGVHSNVFKSEPDSENKVLGNDLSSLNRTDSSSSDIKIPPVLNPAINMIHSVIPPAGSSVKSTIELAQQALVSSKFSGLSSGSSANTKLEEDDDYDS